MTNPQQRNKLLYHLYSARETKPRSGWVGYKDLVNSVGECEFSIDVLVELGFVKKDGMRYRITGQGVLEFERISSDA